MNKQIEWFCYHAVAEELVTKAQCRAVAEAMGDAEIEADLGTFVQVIIDNDLCEQFGRLEEIMEMAEEESRTLGPPPESCFGEAAHVWGAEEDAGATEQQRMEDRPVLNGDPGEEWLKGWPDLSQAATLDPDAALPLLDQFLAQARDAHCSDVHISAGAYPFVRRFKKVHLVPGQKVITPEAAEALNLAALSPSDREGFRESNDLDYCYARSESERYRTNLMLQRLGYSGSYRIVDNRVLSLQELGFLRPDVIEKLTTYHQGLILVTGPAGCGKSTTLSSLIDLINRNRSDHIITVEDPIEVVHHPKRCNITQRELGTHTRSFHNALRAALREDPDIIVIGELRDLETIEMAIRASETGHLVIGTLHTSSASSTMDRVLDVFPPNQQAQIRSMAAESLKGVICQQLVPNRDEDGVVLTCEIMLGTLAAANLIREGKTFQLPSVIQAGKKLGMTTMEQSLVDLYMAGLRTYEQTLPLVKTPDLLHQIQSHEAKQVAGAAAGAGPAKTKRRWL